MNRKHRLLAFLTAAVLMAALPLSPALAAGQPELFQFLSGSLADPIIPLDDAEELVQTDLATVENDLITLHVEEAIFDGQGVLVQLRFAPKDAERYALSSALGDEEIGERTEIFCDVQEVRLTDANGGEINVIAWDYAKKTDGSLALQGIGYSDEPLDAQATLQIVPYAGIVGEWDEERQDNRTPVDLDSITIPMTQAAKLRRAVLKPVGEPAEGLQILGGALTLTPICAYLTYDYRCERMLASNTTVIIQFYDGEGAEINWGLGTEARMDDAQGRYEHAQRIIQTAPDFPERLYFTATDVYGYKQEPLGRVECEVIEE